MIYTTVSTLQKEDKGRTQNETKLNTYVDGWKRVEFVLYLEGFIL